ncbi:MAG: late competence development ComFB family protein [Defluviitaleaceae bacterium]|nr:late competence development ComFB family protein [Defluviitaleaceae bacterium]
MLENIKIVLGSTDYCKCDHCVNDIAAIALNELPAKYAVTSEGEVYTKLDTLSNDYKVQILTVVSKAAHRVGGSPRHAHNNS